MDYSNIETRRVIWTVLDEARRVLGKPLNTDGRLLIEASPLEDGGCILSFTSLPSSDSKSKKRMIMKKNCEPVALRALSEDSFLDTLRALGEAPRKTEAYLLNGKYYLIFYPETILSGGFLLRLSEFGDFLSSPKREIPVIYEHGLRLSIAPLISAEPKMKLPETRTSAPASTQSLAVSGTMPPST